MPELPEVQIIVEDLKKKIVGRRITGVWFDAPKIITLQLAQGDGELSRTAQGKRKIKQVLMDQEVIVGIGNIYSDEILWQV